MTDPDMRRVLAAVRSAVTAPVIDDPHDHGDISDARRPSDAELEVLDLLHLPHPRPYVRLSMADWATVDRIAEALAMARTHEGER